MTKKKIPAILPILYLDHDGTWSWSLESGKPFEADHRVYDRGEGCHNRRQATREAQAALKRIVESGCDTLGRKI